MKVEKQEQVALYLYPEDKQRLKEIKEHGEHHTTAQAIRESLKHYHAFLFGKNTHTSVKSQA